METYINKFSWKCLLGKQSKNANGENGIYIWEVGKKKHFTTDKLLSEDEIKEFAGRSFHYLNLENIENIKKFFKVTKTKCTSVYWDLKGFNLSGKKNAGLRHSINSASKQNLIVQDSFDKIEDVHEMLKEWSSILSEKYFRDFSGKSDYFYSNAYHKDCINIFVYKIIDGQKKLVSFASASPEKENCSYIVGKALCNRIHGLSEYTDYLLVQKLIEMGFDKINLGLAGTKGLLKYKMKFPGAVAMTHYDGKYE